MMLLSTRTVSAPLNQCKTDHGCNPISLRGVQVDALCSAIEKPGFLYVYDSHSSFIHTVHADRRSHRERVNVSAVLGDGTTCEDTHLSIDSAGVWLYLECMNKTDVNHRSILMLFWLPTFSLVKLWTSATISTQIFAMTAMSDNGKGSLPKLFAVTANQYGTAAASLDGVEDNWQYLDLNISTEPQTRESVALQFVIASANPTSQVFFVIGDIEVLVYDLTLERVIRSMIISIPPTYYDSSIVSILVDPIHDRLYTIVSSRPSEPSLLLIVTLSTNITIAVVTDLPEPAKLSNLVLGAGLQLNGSMREQWLYLSEQIRDVVVEVHLVNDTTKAVYQWMIGSWPTTRKAGYMSKPRPGEDGLFVQVSQSIIKWIPSKKTDVASFGLDDLALAGVVAGDGFLLVGLPDATDSPLARLNSSNGLLMDRFVFDNVSVRPGALALDDAGEIVYICNTAPPGQTIAFNITSRRVVQEYNVGSRWQSSLFPSGVIIAGDGAGVLYVSSSVPCETSMQLCIVSYFLNGTVRSVVYDPWISSPANLAVSLDGTYVYICNTDTQIVSVIDTRVDLVVGYLRHSWKRLDAVVVSSTDHIIVAADDALYIFPLCDACLLPFASMPSYACTSASTSTCTSLH